MDRRHLLKVSQRNIAHSEKTRASGITLFCHRFPAFRVRGGPAVAGGRPVQHKAVHVVSPKMFERTGDRLCNLSRKTGRGIIR